MDYTGINKAAKVADVGGNAQLGCVLYLLYDLKATAAPASLPDPLVD